MRDAFDARVEADAAQHFENLVDLALLRMVVEIDDDSTLHCRTSELGNRDERKLTLKGAMTVPNVSGEVRSICAKLGLDPMRVQRLEITPAEAVAYVFVPDPVDGAIHLNGKGEVPLFTVTTTIRT